MSYSKLISQKKKNVFFLILTTNSIKKLFCNMLNLWEWKPFVTVIFLSEKKNIQLFFVTNFSLLWSSFMYRFIIVISREIKQAFFQKFIKNDIPWIRKHFFQVLGKQDKHDHHDEMIQNIWYKSCKNRKKVKCRIFKGNAQDYNSTENRIAL